MPIEETVGAIAEMIRRAMCGTSVCRRLGAETVRRAHAVHPVADLQIEYSLLSRGIEAEILPTCRELGVGVTAYGVLSRGLLGGHWSSERAASPATCAATCHASAAENLERNLALVEALRAIAEAKGVTVAQLAIAWVLARGEDIVPLVGARARSAGGSARCARAGAQRGRPCRDRARSAAGAAAGERYDERQMAMLDSERSRAT